MESKNQALQTVPPPPPTAAPNPKPPRKVGRPKREDAPSLQEQIEAKQRAAASLFAEAKKLASEQKTRAASVVGDLVLTAMEDDGAICLLVVGLLRDAKLSPRDRASIAHLLA
jgi:hypothetical protein